MDFVADHPRQAAAETDLQPSGLGNRIWSQPASEPVVYGAVRQVDDVATKGMKT